ncbi:MAG TPA: MFS transporter, partial [Methylotenera sp.]|nr:MFS transporter [Methylotenera sp.]
KSNSVQSGRPVIQIMRQPKFIVAMMCAMLGYGTMSFIMTATPLAMHAHTHSLSDTSFVIQWHVLGMFAPSFVTGHLIRRFGVLKIMFVGGLLGVLCVFTNLLGHSVWHYWLALTLLGISWNFLYIGGTTLLTETYTSAEKGKAQGANDFIIFTTVTLSSLTAGVLQHKFGWQTVNMGVIPFLLLILTSISWLALKLRQDVTPEQDGVQDAVHSEL